MIFAFNFLNAQNKENTIIGKWIGTDETNKTAGIEFIDNGKAKLLMFDKEMPPCNYEVDYQKDPMADKQPKAFSENAVGTSVILKKSKA